MTHDTRETLIAEMLRAPEHSGCIVVAALKLDLGCLRVEQPSTRTLIGIVDDVLHGSVRITPLTAVEVQEVDHPPLAPHEHALFPYSPGNSHRTRRSFLVPLCVVLDGLIEVHDARTGVKRSTVNLVPTPLGGADAEH